MKKIYKYLLLIVVIFMFIYIYMIKPKEFNHIYKNAYVYKNGVKEKNVDIKITAEILTGNFIFSEFKFSKQLKGEVMIDGLKYYLFPTDNYIFPNEDGIYTDNDIYSGILSNTSNELNDAYYFYLSKNNDILYITSIEYHENGLKEIEEILYPMKDDSDYIKIKEKIKHS